MNEFNKSELVDALNDARTQIKSQIKELTLELEEVEAALLAYQGWYELDCEMKWVS